MHSLQLLRCLMNRFSENRDKVFVVSLDNDSNVTKDILVIALNAKNTQVLTTHIV